MAESAEMRNRKPKLGPVLREDVPSSKLSNIDQIRRGLIGAHNEIQELEIKHYHAQSRGEKIRLTRRIKRCERIKEAFRRMLIKAREMEATCSLTLPLSAGGQD